jgi:cell wall-associated NlpC family hydrolase
MNMKRTVFAALAVLLAQPLLAHADPPDVGSPPHSAGPHPTLAGDPHDVPPMKVGQGSSDTVKLADNPPNHTWPPGPGRDAGLLEYLSKQAGAMTGSITPDIVLPDPDAVSELGLKTVGAAAEQQGVSYAWGGGHAATPGVTRGTLTRDRFDKYHNEDGSWTYHDNGRIGFDCSGLARFATYTGHGGLDISAGKGNEGNTVGQYRTLIVAGSGAVVSDDALKPGDLIYYGAAGNSHHVAIYAGNGLVVQAQQSGVPVEVSPMVHSEQHRNVHVKN